MTTSHLRDLVSAPSTMLADELESVVDAVCMKHPNRDRAEVELVVANAYAHIKEKATVEAHLVPLTLNRSLRLMRTVGAGTCSMPTPTRHPPR